METRRGFAPAITAEPTSHVAIDQLAGDVSVHCPSCGETPATRQLVRASLAAAHDH